MYEQSCQNAALNSAIKDASAVKDWVRKPIRYVSESKFVPRIELNCAISGQEFPRYLSKTPRSA